MIVDQLKNAKKYYGLGDGFREALSYLCKHQDQIMASVTLPGGVKITSTSYTTKNKEACVFEAHKKYADIHLIVKGCETIGYAPMDQLRITQENAEKDLVLLEGKGVNIPLSEMDFMILFPQEAHMVGLRCGEQDECSKLIVKIPFSHPV